MKIGSSLLISAFVLGCASLFLACERQPDPDHAQSSESEDSGEGQTRVRETEPNDSVENGSAVPMESVLVGEVAAGEEDVLLPGDEWHASASSLEITASSGSVTIDLVQAPLRWNLASLTAGEAVGIRAEAVPRGAAVIISGAGEWSVERVSDVDSRPDETDDSPECRHAPSDPSSSLRWIGDEPDDEVKICLVGDGTLTLPDSWSGRAVRVSGRTTAESDVAVLVPTSGNDPVRLNVTMGSPHVIETVRLAEERPLVLRFAVEEPVIIDLALRPSQDSGVVDVEPNDTRETAVDVGDASPPYSGTIHPGETVDWLSMPWLEAETVSFALALSTAASASFRWQTVDGGREVAVADNASSVSACGIWREPGSERIAIAVSIAEPAEQPIGWTIRATSPSVSSFEREPNEERLLPLEVPEFERDDPGAPSVQFALPGRPPAAQVSGTLGNQGDVLDTLPLRVLSVEGHEGATEVEVILHPPGSADLGLSLVDEDGALVARGLDGGTGGVERVRAMLPDGIYHVVIEFVSGEECAGVYRVEASTASVSEEVNENSEARDDATADSSTSVEEPDATNRREREPAPPPLLRNE